MCRNGTARHSIYILLRIPNVDRELLVFLDNWHSLICGQYSSLCHMSWFGLMMGDDIDETDTNKIENIEHL